MKNHLEQGHGTQPNQFGMKDLWLSSSQFAQVVFGGKRSGRAKGVTQGLQSSCTRDTWVDPIDSRDTWVYPIDSIRMSKKWSYG